jgi:CHAT domain-containing protein
LGAYRDVIFYTHGVFDERNQEMTGLALSRLNKECGAEKTFLLNLNDIYNLELSADLVTLIACNTARNQTMRGFGLGSIARGFMYAGAARVMGTLWEVHDQSSLELATRFYQNRRAGQTASQALRNAQLSFLNDDNSVWRLPYYWAGFVLIGEVN